MGGAHDPFSRQPTVDAAARRARLQGSLQVVPGLLAAAIDAERDAANRAALALWRRDPSLWSAEAETQAKIASRLGWLNSPALMVDGIAQVQLFADAVRRDGFTHVVLLGMGGSSLAPEVLRAVLGVTPGWPQLIVLDSTDPAAVLAASTPPETTLYLLASKSGTTIEPNALAAHFRARVEASVTGWAEHFVAITDENTDLARRARLEHFRHVFINPSDIGGRYSAISYFGLVPAALMGQDVRALVDWSLAMLAAAEPEGSTFSTNPAAALGLVIGAAARAGRDKLTLVVPPELESFGLWVEQLIAESTGKLGTGVVPITGEPLTAAATHGRDRFFVRVTLPRSAPDEANDAAIRRLKAAGAPIADIEMVGTFALGAEFLRWEIATAIAGALLRVNPFDEPNVQQAKDATRRLLNEYQASARLPFPAPTGRLPNGATLALTEAARRELRGQDAAAILTLLRPSDYFALLAYVGPDQAIADTLRTFRNQVRDRTAVATTLGYGPRYLHSTGQLHKGGPNTGLFVLLTAGAVEDVPIPGQPFSFGTLEFAQALGDFASLDAAGRRAIHVHLPRQEPESVRDVASALLAWLPQQAG